MTKKQTNSWEEEFDNKFLGTSVDFPYGTMFGDLYLSKEIKNFISKTISQEKEKIIEEIKKVYVGWTERTEERDDSYDDAFLDGTEVMQKKILDLLQK